MGKVLYIKANAKSSELSKTFKISDSFIESYKETHPNDEIITLDLYDEGINFLTKDNLDDLSFKPSEAMEHPVLKYAYQFLEADKYVIAEPLWNLSIPSILKAYIDYICAVGITFKYTEEGPIGLCKNKKAINITTRGGIYSTEPYSDFEMGDKYLRTIFAYLGIIDFTTIAAKGLDIIGNDVDDIISSSIIKARENAKDF